MKTIIAGSRSATYEETLLAVSNSHFMPNTNEVVSGKAHGADMHGETIAKHLNLPVKEFLPDWRVGKHAGVLRNQQMADYADALIAVWDGKSPGTHDMIRRAKKKGLKIYIHHFRA